MRVKKTTVYSVKSDGVFRPLRGAADINGKLFVIFFLYLFHYKVNLILSYPSQVVLTLP